jgi:hypothetical protein
MNNSKDNTQNSQASSKSLFGQKTLSVVLGAAMAVIALLQTSNANSNEMRPEVVSAEEAALLAEIELWFLEEEMNIEEKIYFETNQEIKKEVKVFNSNNELVGEGDPLVDPILNKLVNQADFLSEMSTHKYYRIGH